MKCPNCGYCKECGRSDRPVFVPYPVPYYPMPTLPWWQLQPWSTAGGNYQNGTITIVGGASLSALNVAES